jgi:thioredoxin-like negative regulator of GroEL
MGERFYSGWTFDEMTAAARANTDLWKSIRTRATVAAEAVRRVESLDGTWHLLVLSEDWCTDSVSTVPFVDELATRAGNLDLRILSRDRNPDLMDSHLTEGVLRAIPVVLLLDEGFHEVGWWGPRPAPLREWLAREGAMLDKDAKLRERRRWYARDHGRTAIEEIVEMIENAAEAAHCGSGASASTSAP